MKYIISYILPSEPQKNHMRYYSALNKDTALEMFRATCEESLAGEHPLDINVKEIPDLGFNRRLNPQKNR